LATGWRHVSAVAGPGKLTIRVLCINIIKPISNPNPNSNQKPAGSRMSTGHNPGVWTHRACLSANAAVTSQLG
jgi:hypothetical protein